MGVDDQDIVAEEVSFGTDLGGGAASAPACLTPWLGLRIVTGMTNLHTKLAPLAGMALAAGLSAQFEVVNEEQLFASPVRLMAGEKYMGAKRAYPSPVFHDVNGDGHLDIVVGDLPGALTVALRKGAGMEFEAEKKLKGADGQPLKFNNW